MGDLQNELNCRGLVEVVTDYLEDVMAPSEAEVIEQHLESCEGCRRYLAQMRITVQTVGKLRDEDVPVEVRERLLSAFRELRTAD
jgi:predicted anti-sigma-YlaC factor YlaD